MAAVPSPTSPSAGAASRWIREKRRSVAPGPADDSSGPAGGRRARLSAAIIPRRRLAASGLIPPPAPFCAFHSLMTLGTHRYPRADYAAGRLNEGLTPGAGRRDFPGGMGYAGSKRLGWEGR